MLCLPGFLLARQTDSPELPGKSIQLKGSPKNLRFFGGPFFSYRFPGSKFPEIASPQAARRFSPERKLALFPVRFLCLFQILVPKISYLIWVVAPVFFDLDPELQVDLAAQQALEEAFGHKPVLVREGGSIPIIEEMKRVLEADALARETVYALR